MINWNLVLRLSLFGLAMAILTVFWIPQSVEPLVWLVIFVLCAYFVAKQVATGHFLHGFLISIVNSIWITTLHVVFYEVYMNHHPELMEVNTHLPMQNHPRVFMAVTGPFVGAVFGLVLGFFCFVGSKLVKRTGSMSA